MRLLEWQRQSFQLISLTVLCTLYCLTGNGQERRRIYNGQDTIFSEKMVTPDTKVIVKSATGMGKFYLYVDSILINRSPQLQVGVLDLIEKPSYQIRVVFQDRERPPVTGTINPEFEQTKLYVIYGGSKIEVEQQKAKTKGEEKPLLGDTSPDTPAMPEYHGRLGCDYPIGEEVIIQYVSLMTSINERTPKQWAYELVTTQCITTTQFSEILDNLKNDEERIEISKTAWYYIYDQENFEQLRGHFENHTAVDMVLEYVKHNQ